MRRGKWFSASALALATFCFVGALAVSARAAESDYATIQRGRYLFQAGDCAACHTVKGGPPLAGGRAIPTPFGTVYASNITPDPETGIGKWSTDDFYRAMHEGKRPDGSRLYPAFPYPWYTKLTREDVRALKAYLDTQPAIYKENREPDFPWPLSMRLSVMGWNMIFFEKGVYQPDQRKSAEWNRGAYLVEALGHCGGCHTPKNILGGTKKDAHLQGGYGENWFSPALSGNKRDGLGAWSIDDIVEYLKTGSNAKSAASGPMAEVIEYSTQHLSDADLKAMAVYLKDLPPTEENEAEAPKDGGGMLELGKALYVDNCSACHLGSGQGQDHAIPPMAGNAIVQSANPDTLLHAILSGGHAAATKQHPTGLAMPPFGWKLNDAEAAAVASYVRNAWGNRASLVDEATAGEVRQRVREIRN